MNVAHIPLELRQRDAWAVWRYESDHNGHVSKPPFRADGSGLRAYASHRDTWSSFDAALRAYREHPELWCGISVAVAPDLVGIDLDKVSQHPEQAREIADLLCSYTEHSPGGDGLRIFVHAELPGGHRCRREWVEIYTERRFLTVTGERVLHYPSRIQARQAELEYVYFNYLDWTGPFQWVGGAYAAVH